MRSPFPIGPCVAAGLLLLSGCGGSSLPAGPGIPGNLAATAGDGQVSLTWTAVSDATSYTVHYHEQNAPEAVRQHTVLTGSSALVTGLLDHVPYVFSVDAVSGNGTSASPAVVATPVPAVSLVSIAITPASTSTGWPAQQIFTAVGTYSDGSTPTITDSVQWFSDTPGVAMANGSVVTTEATGSALISSHLDGISSNSATVTVGAKVPTASGVGTTTTATPATLRVSMDVQSTLEDGTWLAAQETIAQQPVHGVATVTGQVVSYVPAPGYSGPDTVVLQEITQSGQIIAIGSVVLGSNVNTNTDTRTITISVE